MSTRPARASPPDGRSPCGKGNDCPLPRFRSGVRAMPALGDYFFLPFFAPFFAFFAFLPFLAAMILVPFSALADLLVSRALCFFAARFALRGSEGAALAGPLAPLPTACFRVVRGTAS